MTNLKHLLISAMIVLQPAVLRPALGQNNAKIAAEVKELGTEGDNVQIVEHLSATPQVSVRFLIDELHTVTADRILGTEDKPETEHILWCIRALRYITGGLDFCGKTNHNFGTSELEKNRKYWLYFKSKSCVPFFAMWPSRGSVYISPPDAQQDIIKRWRDWQAREGKTFHYSPLKNPKPEAWLW